MLVGAKTAYIIPGSPWENGYCESFNSLLRNELIDGEIFYTLKDEKLIIEGWRRHYNTVHQHSSLNHKPPALKTVVWPRQNGRLQLQRWQSGRVCTNIKSGSLHGGRSTLQST